MPRPSTTLSRRRALGLGGALALSAPAGALSPRGAGAVTVILVRHAEKEAEGDDPGLTAHGEARARALDGLLAGVDEARVFTTKYARTRATVAPLAARLGVAPEEYDPRDLKGFAARLAQLEPGTLAVVAGHSNTTPVLATALGGRIGDLDERGFFHDDEYSRLLLVVAAPPDGAAAGALASLELRYFAEPPAAEPAAR